MATLANLVVNLTAETAQFRRSMEQATNNLNRQFGQVQRTADQFKRAVTGALVAVGAVQGVRAAITAFTDYDNTMRRVGAITGATEGQIDSMREVVKRMGTETKFSAGEAASGMEFLAMAGLDVTQSIQALPGVLELAAAGAIDLGTAANIATNVLSGYGLEVAELTRVNDVLAKAFTSSNTNLQQLGTAFTYAGPIAKAAGQEFEVTAAVLGLMANAGFAGEKSGTALRGSLARLLKPTNEVSETLAKLGVDINDSTGNMRSLDQIMIELGASGASAADMLAIFGVEAGPAMVAAVGQGREGIEAMVQNMRDAEGTASRVAKALKDSFGGAMLELKSATEGFAIALIELLDEAMVAAINLLTTGFRAVVRLIEGLTPAWQETIGAWVSATPAAIDRIGDLIGRGIDGIVGLFRSLVDGYERALGLLLPSTRSAFADIERIAGDGVGAVERTFLDMPATWTAVVSSIPRALEAALRTAVLYAIRFVVQVRNSWDELIAASAQTWNAIKAFTLSVMASIEEAVINAYRSILGAIGDLVASAGVELQGLARTTSTVSETMARGIEDAAISMQSLGRDMRATGTHSSSLRDSVAILTEQNAELDQGTRNLNSTYAVQIQTLDEMIREEWEAVAAIQAEVQEKQLVVEAIDREVTSRTDATDSIQQMAEATEESTEAMDGAKKSTDGLRDSLEATGPAAEEAASETARATDLIDQSWKTLSDNVQNLFAKTFSDLFKGTWDGWRGLMSSMWDLFAQFAAQIASQRIMISMGIGGAGISGAAQAAGGGGMLGGIGSAISGGLGSVLGGIGTSLGGMLAGIAPGGFAAGMLSTGGALSSAGIFSGGAAALSNIGGLAAAGQFAAALGAAVPILLPIAGLLAGLLGSSTPPRAFVVGDAATGELLQQVEKKGQDATALIAMLNSIVETTSETLSNIGGKLGEGQAQFDIHINPDRLRLTFVPGSGWEDRLALDVDPEDSAAIADAVAKMVLAAATDADFSEAAAPIEAFFDSVTLGMVEALPQGAADQIIGQFQNIGAAATAAAEQFPWLADAIRDTATTTDMGAQELAAYTVALIAVGQALSTDPVDLYRQAVEAQSATLIDRLAAQGEQVQQLAAQYDGSAQSAEALAGGVLQLQQSAVEALAQIDAARQSVTDSVANARQQIDLSLMNQAEKVAFWLGEAERLREELSAATDPSVINQLAQDTTAALLQAWQNMDEDRRGSEADFIRAFLDSIDATAAQGLDAAASDVHQIWTDAAQTVETTLSGAATALHDAASAIRSASQALQAAIPDTIHVSTSVTVNTSPHDQPGGGRALGGFVHAASGWIGNPGAAGADTIPILVGAGEAVLNRHQQRIVTGALQGQYGFGLDGLFSRERRPHTAAFQHGGVATPTGHASGMNSPDAVTVLNRLADAIAEGRTSSRELAAAARDLPRRIVVELPRNELTVR